MKKLKSYQYNVVSRFCEDLAKGLMLAIILGQTIVRDLSPIQRIFSITTSSSSALLLLILAIYFSKEKQHE
ncbi:MAG: hypothetical protein ACD_19C00182G0052 [uncultured bacterium]|nr:MAG: hypothetical protein ACD_19C00182G0052 [uncultured bacterium]